MTIQPASNKMDHVATVTWTDGSDMKCVAILHGYTQYDVENVYKLWLRARPALEAMADLVYTYQGRLSQ